jgi:murein DD-endopeptidase MepM/ murein hydrolase activator NlpD
LTGGQSAPVLTSSHKLPLVPGAPAGIDGHAGYDFVVPQGTPVRAVTDGVVVAAGAESPWFCPLLQREVSGLFVRVYHRLASGEVQSLSLHLSRIDVVPGARVVAGQQLGLSGNTGCSTGPHLHFAVRRLLEDLTLGPALDPYGWDDATTPDPWATHPWGAASTSLWRAGKAPPIYSEAAGSLPPSAAVGIVRVRWMGVRDATTPSNEFVDVERAAWSPAVDLAGWSLRTLSGASWSFPSGIVLDETSPRVRVYVGAPMEAGSLGMRMPRGILGNQGDCLTLESPAGMRFTVAIRMSSCPVPPAGAVSGTSAGQRATVAPMQWLHVLDQEPRDAAAPDAWTPGRTTP